MKTAKSVLTATHPEYTKRKADWDFYLQSYEGGSNYFTTENIFTHTREGYDDYKFRLKRATYQNYCDSIIGIYSGHLFKKPVVRQTEGDEEFEAFFKDVDRQGNSIDDFFKDIAGLMQAMGFVYVLVDKPRTNGEIKTAADEQSNGVTPYYTIVYPQNVPNWELDSDGNFEWVRIQEVLQEQTNPFGTRETKTQYRTFSRTEWWVHDGEGELTDAGTHGLGQVPLVPVYNRRLKRYPLFGWAAIEDIAYINRTLANLSSLIDEFVYRQCFDVLVMPAQGIAGAEDAENEIKLSTSNLLAVSGEGFQPYYLAPEVSPAEFLMNYCRELRAIIYMLAKIEAPDVEPVESSGISKQWSFHETNNVLADKADNLEQAEIKCHRLRANWMDKEWSGVIDYPEDFDIRRVNQELEDALQVKLYGLPKKFLQEYDKQLWRKILPKTPKEMAAQIDAEIEKGVSSLASVSEEEEATVRRLTGRLQEGE